MEPVRIVCWGFSGAGALSIEQVSDDLAAQNTGQPGCPPVELIHLDHSDDLPDNVDAVWIQGVLDPDEGRRLLAAAGEIPVFSSPPVTQDIQVATSFGMMTAMDSPGMPPAMETMRAKKSVAGMPPSGMRPKTRNQTGIPSSSMPGKTAGPSSTPGQSPPPAMKTMSAAQMGSKGNTVARMPVPARIAVALMLMTPLRIIHAARLTALHIGATDIDPGPLPDDVPHGLVDTGIEQPDRPLGTVGVIAMPLHEAIGDGGYIRDMARVLAGKNLAAVVWLGSPADMPDDVKDGIDVWLNLTGFTMLGHHGAPMYEQGTDFLTQTNTPVITPVPLQRGTLADWRDDDPGPVGLWPAAVSMNIAVPELEGATTPWVYGGRDAHTGAMCLDGESAERIADRIRRTITLKNTPKHQRKVSLTIFGWDGDGTIGTAAQMDVFASLHRILSRLKSDGYTVEVPATVEELTDMIVGSGGGGRRSEASVLARWRAADYARALDTRQRARIDSSWGLLPGAVDTTGGDMIIRGARFGNVVVGCQPQFGDVDDPAELLYNEDATPSHSFAAYYLWLEEVFGHDVMVHVGTHGALEFMPGRQTGLATNDWPVYLCGSVPHIYLYVMANPGEGTIAKRRAAAQTVTYLTPPLDDAGLYGDLEELAGLLHEQLRQSSPFSPQQPNGTQSTNHRPTPDIVAAAKRANFTDEQIADTRVLHRELEKIRRTPVAMGLHVIGEPMSREQTRRSLELAATYADDPTCQQATDALRELEEKLQSNTELESFLNALDGRYTPPVAGGDPARQPDALPTGRNIHAIDPVSIPTATAIRRGKATADKLLAAYRDSHNGSYPSSVAVVLWGIDNIKTSGEGLAQAFALIGATPVRGPRGRVDDFTVIPLEELGRPRVDVVATLSGVCRDVLPHPVELLDKAVRHIATLDEPAELNPIAHHAKATADQLDIAAVDAATRIFSAGRGSYGTGVNRLVQACDWETDDDLAEMYLTRMGHAWGTRQGADVHGILRSVLTTVDATFQNIDSAETSIAGIDHYFEFLGGVTTAVTRARGGSAPSSLVSQSWQAETNVDTLESAMALESRTRILNPKWIDAQLVHGYAGVAAVRTRLENTFGMQATTKTVGNWVFDRAADVLLFDDNRRSVMERANPAAVSSMTNRLLEAAERNLWQTTGDTIDRLEDIADRLDGALEGIEPTDIM